MIELSPDYRPDPTINPHQVFAEMLVITQLIVSELSNFSIRDINFIVKQKDRTCSIIKLKR